MIKSWEELGEVLAEFENRLSVLENSIPNIKEIGSPIDYKTSSFPLSKIIGDTLTGDNIKIIDWLELEKEFPEHFKQLNARLTYLTNKFNEHLDKSKKKKPKDVGW